jgi:hypothetical protein
MQHRSSSSGGQSGYSLSIREKGKRGRTIAWTLVRVLSYRRGGSSHESGVPVIVTAVEEATADMDPVTVAEANASPAREVGMVTPYPSASVVNILLYHGKRGTYSCCAPLLRECLADSYFLGITAVPACLVISKSYAWTDGEQK